VPCVKKASRVLGREWVGLVSWRALQRQAGCVEFVQKCMSSGNETVPFCGISTITRSLLTESPNFTDLKMKVTIIRLDVDCPEVALEGPY